MLPKVVGLGVSWRQSRECPDPICIPTTPGMNRNNPPLGQPMRSAQSLAEGEGWGAALGALRGALFRLCPHSPPLLPPPHWVGLVRGSNLQTSTAWLLSVQPNPEGTPRRSSAVTPPSHCPTPVAPSQQDQWESARDTMQSSGASMPGAQPHADAAALNATAALPCSPFVSI